MKTIQKIYSSHTINTIFLSVISVYIPVYLLTLGYSLQLVVLFYIIYHGIGLTTGLFLYVPLMRRWGLINTFKLYYPLQICLLILLYILSFQVIPLWIIAIIGGAANYAYWMPLNLLFIKYSEKREMGSNLAKFFAFPKLFGIIGPLISAFLYSHHWFLASIFNRDHRANNLFYSAFIGRRARYKGTSKFF